VKISKLNEMTRGWFIGDFEPSIIRTKAFEVGILTHKKDEDWGEHYHKIATEYNILLKGKMSINGTVLNEGDIFILEPMETALPIFMEDCVVLCVKVPSVIGDKYLVGK
jgi:hypothetical protein